MRCEICGRKECCGSELGPHIAELEAENERLREALDYARKEIANIPYPMRDVIGVLDSALCKPDEEEEDK